jgi:hypothetical protein
MKNTPPLPICKAFLVCRRVDEDRKIQDTVLIGLPRALHAYHYPCGASLGMFARCTSAHGDYRIEVQLQTPEGEIVWRDGPPQPWKLANPLEMYDLKLNFNVVFPGVGVYDIVLVANGEEVARQTFHAHLKQPPPTEQ